MAIPPGTNTLSIGRSPSFGLTYSANYPGKNLSVQSNTNLLNTSGWSTVPNTTVPANGVIQKYPINTTENSSCFYRLNIAIDRSPLIVDPKLEDAIWASLPTNTTTLTTSNLATIATLNLNDMGITTLDGIENLTGLTNISLTNNAIVVYSPLSSLPITSNGLNNLVTVKETLENNNRDHFAETNSPFYVQANTIDQTITGTLVKYVHSDYKGQIHTEGQWYAGFQLAEQGTTTPPLTTEQSALLDNLITAGESYFPKLSINDNETSLQGWIKTDHTSAADADVFRIMTLSLAGKTADAIIGSNDFFQYETKEVHGLTIPLCGVNDTNIKMFDSPFYTIKGNQTVFIWNPSYSYSYASNLLNDLNPKWANLQRSQNLINSKVLDAYGLVDWCVVLIDNDTGEISTSLDIDKYFPRTNVDSFHINQIFSGTLYANNWKEKEIFTEDTDGYLTYKSGAPATIDALLTALEPTTPENAKTKQALTLLKENSEQDFPGRGENINLTEQKEWPRFIMDHLMSYAKYNDAYSLEMINKIIEKHGINLETHPIYTRYQALIGNDPITSDDNIIKVLGAVVNKTLSPGDLLYGEPLYGHGLLYYEWPNEIVIAIRTAIKALTNTISSNDVATFHDKVLDVRSNVSIGNKTHLSAINTFMSQHPDKYQFTLPDPIKDDSIGTLYVYGAITAQESIDLKNIFINEEEKINGLQERSLITGYGEKWYDGKDWTFNQLIIGFIVNCILQKIKLP